jgi:uncharacterized protein YdeI (BOF family)
MKKLILVLTLIVFQNIALAQDDEDLVDTKKNTTQTQNQIEHQIQQSKAAKTRVNKKKKEVPKKSQESKDASKQSD